MPAEDLRNREQPGRGDDALRDECLDAPLDRVPGETQRASNLLVRGERIAGQVREDPEVLLVDHGFRFIKRAIFEIVRPDEG
jgi:hypothetical protein